MKPVYYPDLSSFAEAAERINASADTVSVMLLFAENHRRETDAVQAFFSMLKKPFFGAFFPGLIAASSRKESGFVMIPLKKPVHTRAIPFGLTEPEFDEEIEVLLSQSGEDVNSVICFTDALGKGKPQSIEYLYNYFGIGVNYIGGGAGSLSFESFPCVFNQEGVFANASLIGLTSQELVIGVAHGWNAVSEPMKVTKANGNLLQELEWQPAFEVYRKLVEQHSGLKFTDSNFFDIAKSYPFGMVKIDSEMIIRDPIQVIGSEIHVVDEIHEGEYVSLMHGNMESLLKGARSAREKAALKLGERAKEIRHWFSIDCISRSLFMGDQFNDELAIIGGDTDVYGALTIGEIANSGELFLEIYNKTVVVSTM